MNRKPSHTELSDADEIGELLAKAHPDIFDGVAPAGPRRRAR